MKIISWNVNGIRSILQKGFIDYLELTQPDIIGIQETKAQEDQIPLELFEKLGFHPYVHSAKRKGYSGVMTLTKQEPLSVVFGIGDDQFDDEGRVLITEFKNFTYINAYIPNGQRTHARVPFKLKFSNKLLQYAENLRRKQPHIIMSGDFNTAHHPIDLARPTQNKNTTGFLPKERAYLDKLIAHHYVDTFRHLHTEPDHYTWWSYMRGARARNIGWRIDYHFITQEFLPHLQKAEIQNTQLGSDHAPVSIEFK